MGAESKRRKPIWTGMVTRYLPTDDLPTRRFREQLDFLILGGGIGGSVDGGGAVGREREAGSLADAIRQQPFLKGTTHFSGKRDLTDKFRGALRGFGL